MAKAKVKFSFISRDKGYEKIKEELHEAAHGGAFVKVGIIGDKKDLHREAGDPIDSVQLGLIHEFGLPERGIPERSFLRSTVDAKRQEWFSLTRQLVGFLYEGKMTVARALGILGAQAASDVKDHVTEGDGVPPPNAPATARRKEALTRSGSKGIVRTLVDSGRMIGSITWQVVIGGGEEE